MFNSIRLFCQKHVNGINKLFSILFTIYFLIVFLPNISTSIPALSFINSGVVKIAYRSFSALLFTLYLGMAFLANDIRPNNSILIFFSLLAFIFIVSFFINIRGSILLDREIEYADQYARVNVISYQIGFLDAISFLADQLFSLVLFFCMFIVFPVLTKKSKMANLPFYVFIGVMVALVAYSFLNKEDLSGYLKILKLDFSTTYSNDIKSLFPSKNAFGQFLMEGIFVSGYLWAAKKKNFFLIFAFLFYIVLGATINKSGTLCATIFLFILYIRNVKEFKKHFVLNLIICSFIGVMFLFLLLLLTVPAIHASGPLSSLYSFLIRSENSGDERQYLIRVFFEYSQTPQMFFGYSYTLSPNIFVWTKMLTPTEAPLDNLHNGFLMVYATGGVFYLLIYVLLLAYTVIIKFKERDESMKLLFCTIGIIVSFVVFSFFETQILFFSGSSGSILISYILLGTSERKETQAVPLKQIKQQEYQSYEL